MKDYLMNISKELKNFSLSLNKTSILINRPWALVDEDNEIQKLIFKKNKELVLSKNGKVQMGRWDYFPEANSLLIDRKYDTILCNEVFINNAVLILKIDGTSNKYFTLSNENYVPDLDALKYLREYRQRKLNIREYNLEDGRIIEVYQSLNYIVPSIGDKVKMKGEIIVNGFFKIAQSNKYLYINENSFRHIFTEKNYNDIDGQVIQIIQRWNGYFQIGDSVSKDNEILKDNEVNLSKKAKLILQDGEIAKIRRKFFNLWWI